MAEKILIIDDEPELLELLKLVIEDKTRHQVVTTTNPLQAPALLEETPFDLVITDLKMPHLGGIELLETIRKIDPGLPVIILTAYGTIESAVEALQKGAFSYVTKPFKIDEILINIEKALVFERIKKENINLRRELDLRRRSPFLIGKSPAMKKVNQTILEVSHSEAAILISGEPGTGRELVAKVIHFQSPRKEKNFVTFNCSAIPENLVEGELFGYTAGTYPGTLQDKKGLVEEAEEGTLFLDEIGELNLYNQTKLLRLLQEGEYKPLGSNRSQSGNLRFMASTGQDLKEKLKRRDFREDLILSPLGDPDSPSPAQGTEGGHPGPGPTFSGKIREDQSERNPGHSRLTPWRCSVPGTGPAISGNWKPSSNGGLFSVSPIY